VSVAQRWLKVRKELKLTQAQLAEKLEISAPYLSLIESGKRPCPGLAIVRKFQAISKKSLEHLIGGDS